MRCWVSRDVSDILAYGRAVGRDTFLSFWKPPDTLDPSSSEVSIFYLSKMGEEDGEAREAASI